MKKLYFCDKSKKYNIYQHDNKHVSRISYFAMNDTNLR